jgi:hypothetical protein
LATRQPTKAQLEENINRLERVITQLVTGVEATAKLYFNLTVVGTGKFAVNGSVVQKGETIPIINQEINVGLATGDTLQICLNLKDFQASQGEKKLFR